VTQPASGGAIKLPIHRSLVAAGAGYDNLLSPAAAKDVGKTNTWLQVHLPAAFKAPQRSVGQIKIDAGAILAWFGTEGMVKMKP
jgi:hypothetical protein